MSRLLVILFAVLFATPALFAYQPVRWTPLDLYVLKDLPGGPGSLQVLDPAGTLLSEARYSYDTRGRLTEEVFLDQNKQTQGRTEYRYSENGTLTEERLYDRKGQVLSRTRFLYKGPDLTGLEQYNARGQLAMRQTYTRKDGRIVGGVEISTPTGDDEKDPEAVPADVAQKDSFEISYEAQRPVRILVRDAANGVVLEIVYRYDAQGRLAERVRSSFGDISRCVYEYDAQGRIVAYSYANQTAAGWAPQKSFRFAYN